MNDPQENENASAAQAGVVDESAKAPEGDGAGEQQPVSEVQADDAVSAAQSASVDKPADQQSNAPQDDGLMSNDEGLMSIECVRHAEKALRQLEHAAANAIDEFDKIVIADAKAILGKLKVFRDHAPHLFKA